MKLRTAGVATLTCLILSSCGNPVKAATNDQSKVSSSAAQKSLDDELKKQLRESNNTEMTSLYAKVKGLEKSVELMRSPASEVIASRLRNPQTLEDAKSVVKTGHVALFSNAESFLNAYLGKQPKDINALMWLGQLYLSWGDLLDLENKVHFALKQLSKDFQSMSVGGSESGGFDNQRFIRWYESKVARIEEMVNRRGGAPRPMRN